MFISDVLHHKGSRVVTIRDTDTVQTAVGKLAVLACAAALKASAPPAVTEAFIRTRLVTPHGAVYGAATIDAATVELLLQRVLPRV